MRSKPKIFFGGPRKEIERQREGAISILEEMKKDGTIDFVCFDAGRRKPTRVGAQEYLRAVVECDAALFALGSSPGTVYGSGKNATTFTLEEWKQAINLPIPVYLLLSHHLRDSFVEGVKNRTDRIIWQKLRDSIPDKHIIIFKQDVKGDLARQVSLTIANYLSECLSLHAQLSVSWVRGAHSNLFMHLTTPNAATELQDSVKRIRDEVGPGAEEASVDLIAFAYTLRRLSPDHDLIIGLAESWLEKAWLLIMRGDRPAQDIQNLAMNPRALRVEISKWRRRRDLRWFELLDESDRAIVIRWLEEQGLVERYKWDFASEVEIEKFALALAESVEWHLGPGLQNLRSRLYEVYIASLAYARRRDLLSEMDDVQSRIIRLTPSGTGAQGRKLQLQGLCQAVLGKPPDGIPFYESAIEEFKKETPRLVRNIAHSCVMIAAMTAHGKSLRDAQEIKSECRRKIQEETGEEFNKVVNSFYQEVWKRIDNANFERIWHKK